MRSGPFAVGTVGEAYAGGGEEAQDSQSKLGAAEGSTGSAKMDVNELKQARESVQATMDADSAPGWVDRFSGEARKGSDILVQRVQKSG
ncbi:hypothetical protein MNEG_8501 [Monoraphidium neglectum]|uniref:Uncharacterized protein n=1 Tax=Monoraphidium neglectum TaxID=145388 RepID=A0A0D2JJG1_9CHLO|nr:hypothetical protein MNEG_8501 [Monoraphidium neglectum]KIY99457.1 hypothetical protein MNEG_8501 [Monoraphidium neglectum]|eukprot:XP_013898477.1 hypothetical protein MNEG_8501 [Monoraphidium neglectum]